MKWLWYTALDPMVLAMPSRISTASHLALFYFDFVTKKVPWRAVAQATTQGGPIMGGGSWIAARSDEAIHGELGNLLTEKEAWRPVSGIPSRCFEPPAQATKIWEYGPRVYQLFPTGPASGSVRPELRPRVGKAGSRQATITLSSLDFFMNGSGGTLGSCVCVTQGDLVAAGLGKSTGFSF